MTGSEVTIDFDGCFVGEIWRALVGMVKALRLLDLRSEEAGWLGGPIGLSTLNKFDFLVAGDGVGEMRDRVSIDLSDNEGRGLRLAVAG